jgi:hypothetical protein
MYLVFDCALFYFKNAQYKDEVGRITNSREIKNLIDHLKKFSDRSDIQELLVYIEDKLKMR